MKWKQSIHSYNKIAHLFSGEIQIWKGGTERETSICNNMTDFSIYLKEVNDPNIRKCKSCEKKEKNLCQK
jgi:hypothetical protein